MNTKYAIAVLLGMLLVQGVASAETIAGTVMNIEGQKVTLKRADTQETITVTVKDEQSVEAVNPGSQVFLDAQKKPFGGWQAQTLQHN